MVRSRPDGCSYHTIISVDNLLVAWREFLRGKHRRQDVQLFHYHLVDHVLALHHDLTNKTYTHDPYQAFSIVYPKPRNINKASVRDRLLHHAIHRKLYPYFDNTFIHDSYSCRKGKGTHKALDRFRTYAYKVSENHTRTAWVLKCDIRKFFASVDHDILMSILARYITDSDTQWLMGQVVRSFISGTARKGLPLGNLTSQLLANVYMNELDQFVKHQLKAKYYIRYADDFVLLSHDRDWLTAIIPQIARFLESRLTLSLHPNKVSVTTFASGVDFLGWVHFPNHRVLRTATKRKMLRVVERCEGRGEVIQSYRGLLSHGNTRKLQVQLERVVP